MKNILKVLSVVLVFALVSVGLYFILSAFGLVSIDEIRKMIEHSGKMAFLVYLIVQTLILIAFCFVPEVNLALIVLGVVLFKPLEAFILCLACVFISNTALFFIGDKFGEKICAKLIGKKELEHLQDLIDGKSKAILPILFVIPCIPDEALCLVIGMTKIKYWYFILVSLIYHTIEIGAVCFLGSGLIDWASFGVIDWIMFINLVVVDIYLFTKFEKFLENKINKKRTEKQKINKKD